MTTMNLILVITTFSLAAVPSIDALERVAGNGPCRGIGGALDKVNNRQPNCKGISHTQVLDAQVSPRTKFLTPKFFTHVMAPPVGGAPGLYALLRDGQSQPLVFSRLLAYSISLYVIYAHDRLEDPGFNKPVMKRSIIVVLLLFLVVMDKQALASLSILVIAVPLLYAHFIKAVPYLKTVWIPTILVQAACIVADAHASEPAAVWAWITTFASCCGCDIKDVEEDRSRGVKTLATAIGGFRLRCLLTVIYASSAYFIAAYGAGAARFGASVTSLLFAITLWTKNISPTAYPGLDYLFGLPLLFSACARTSAH